MHDGLTALRKLWQQYTSKLARAPSYQPEDRADFVITHDKVTDDLKTLDDGDHNPLIRRRLHSNWHRLRFSLGDTNHTMYVVPHNPNTPYIGNFVWETGCGDDPLAYAPEIRYLSKAGFDVLTMQQVHKKEHPNTSIPRSQKLYNWAYFNIRSPFRVLEATNAPTFSIDHSAAAALKTEEIIPASLTREFAERYNAMIKHSFETASYLGPEGATRLTVDMCDDRPIRSGGLISNYAYRGYVRFYAKNDVIGSNCVDRLYMKYTHSASTLEAVNSGLAATHGEAIEFDDKGNPQLRRIAILAKTQPDHPALQRSITMIDGADDPGSSHIANEFRDRTHPNAKLMISKISEHNPIKQDPEVMKFITEDAIARAKEFAKAHGTPYTNGILEHILALEHVIPAREASEIHEPIQYREAAL